jgi:hypothetical protein
MERNTCVRLGAHPLLQAFCHVFFLLIFTSLGPLQAAPACSLSVGGTAHSFDACPTVSTTEAPIQLYYSLSPSASGGTVVRGGIRAQGVGWAGWGFGSARMAPGTNVVVVKKDASAGTGGMGALEQQPLIPTCRSNSAPQGALLLPGLEAWALPDPWCAVAAGGSCLSCMCSRMHARAPSLLYL